MTRQDQTSITEDLDPNAAPHFGDPEGQEEPEIVIPEIVKDENTARLEHVFGKIYETSMSDVPICNRELSVEAIAHGAFDTEWLGVLITPWCMNLMLLPTDETQDWDDKRTGEKFKYTLPGGRFEFISGKDDELGLYRMCSLFSPMYEFGDHASALATAALALEAAMNEELGEEVNEHEMEMSAIMRGEMPQDLVEAPEYVEEEEDEIAVDEDEVAIDENEQEGEQRIAQNDEDVDQSKRAFLRGQKAPVTDKA